MTRAVHLVLALITAAAITACNAPETSTSSSPGANNAANTTARTEPENAPVTFTSDPSGATLSIGARSYGRTPATVQLPVGVESKYTLTPDEPYEDFKLYKPFTGTITPSAAGADLSVWIDRTTAEEQAGQRQAAEAARQQREREQIAQRVYYKVESNCRYGANLTFSNHNGDTAQYNNQGNAFNYWLIPRRGQFLYLSAQNQCDSGYVTVSFVKDDVVLQTNTSRGGYVIATVSRTW